MPNKQKCSIANFCQNRHCNKVNCSKNYNIYWMDGLNNSSEIKTIFGTYRSWGVNSGIQNNCGVKLQVLAHILTFPIPDYEIEFVRRFEILNVEISEKKMAGANQACIFCQIVRNPTTTLLLHTVSFFFPYRSTTLSFVLFGSEPNWTSFFLRFVSGWEGHRVSRHQASRPEVCLSSVASVSFRQWLKKWNKIIWMFKQHNNDTTLFVKWALIPSTKLIYSTV